MKHVLPLITTMLLLAGFSCDTADSYKEEFTEPHADKVADVLDGERSFASGGNNGYTYSWSPQTVTNTNQAGRGLANNASNYEEQPKEELVSDDGRKMIRRGDFTMKVEEVDDTRLAIGDLVSALKGYIAKESVQDLKASIRHQLVIRVPADRFDQLLAGVTAMAGKVEHKSINVSDVTQEYIDVMARIKTKKELEARYKEILKHAKTVEEILQVEKEIGNLRTQIESAEGQLRYMQNQVSLSTLNLEYYQEKEVEEELAAVPGFFSQLGDAIGLGWQGLLQFIVGMASAWPIWLALGAAIFLGRRIVMVQRKRAIAAK